MTRYVVITLPRPIPANAATMPSNGAPIVRVEAASTKAAIREVAVKHGSGTYVAIPERSWQPETVEVKQETKVSFGDAA